MSNKVPRFNSLRAALDYIAGAPMRLETRVWQTMLQRDLDAGGGWDA